MTIFRKLPLPLLMLACMLLGSALTGTALAYQTHMWNAKSALTRAQNQLQLAIPDKDGHRDAAIRLVGQALTEVQQGIAAGAK
jgi:hypothetical protein